MSQSRRHGDLEIDHDPRFQERVWAWQRAMWASIGAVLLLASLGLFGGGIFGRISLAGPDGRLRVECDRFARREGPAELELEFRPGPGGESRIWLNQDYLDRATVERVSPDPEREVADAAGTTFVLSSPPGETTARARFRLRPRRAGPMRGRARLDDGPEVAFTQYVHP